MIRYIKIKDFQCHKSLFIKLDKNLTILVGKNDSGKSAVVRAIRWTTFNRPLGRSFIRRGSRNATVILGVEQSKIRRTIGVGKNSFHKNGRPYKAIGTSVPPAISQVLNLSEINIQQQHSPYFWFDLTPGSVGKELNKLVDLESIDRVQAEIAKRLRDKKAELEVVKKRLKVAGAGVRLYAPIGGLEKRLNWLNATFCRTTAINAQRQRCGDLIRAGMVAVVGAESSGRAAAVASRGVALWAAGQETTDRAERLSDLLSRLPILTDTIPVPILPKFPDSNQRTQDQLQSLIEQSQDLDVEIQQMSTNLKQKKDSLEKQLGGFCPSCGGILTSRSLI
jgi:hypothetical protein